MELFKQIDLYSGMKSSSILWDFCFVKCWSSDTSSIG